MNADRKAYLFLLFRFTLLEILCGSAVYALLILTVCAIGLDRLLMALPFPLLWVLAWLAGYCCGWLSDITWGVPINRRRQAALKRLERRG